MDEMTQDLLYRWWDGLDPADRKELQEADHQDWPDGVRNALRELGFEQALEVRDFVESRRLDYFELGPDGLMVEFDSSNAGPELHIDTIKTWMQEGEIVRLCALGSFYAWPEGNILVNFGKVTAARHVGHGR